ncbi:MAG: 50S ribosomal protein L1 [Candidatus Curtissbacteria bacterium GW2011_GWA2_41_24]|uniref:Ribosomal protein n=1 Tax=Candidatus Curtissbacteria bacterium GW2011_GWA2_41_24 TaxID=1618411 RepID=A0A0G0VT96_9BACT|nr:MAG: 50S ribosomal protein L1 [Candidatus Curtissbacteria bacterium GW2011_GWA2_41_24]
MGTTRIKVIDLSGEQKEIKTSRKHAEKLSGLAKIRQEKKPKAEVSKEPEEQKITPPSTSSQPSEPSVPSQPSEPSQPSPPSVLPEPSVPPVIKKQSVPIVTKKLRHTGKKYLVATALIDKNKIYPAAEAIDLLYKTSITRFDPDPPAGKAGKQSSISDKHIIWGNENTIADIESGKLKPNRDFDMVLAQPKFMPALAKIAKILGPAGLMPNPKNNTVVENVVSALEGAASATFEYKTDPSAPIVHTKLGKLSYKPEQLTENLKALVTAIGPAKIKKATLTSTMSPPIKTDITTIN